MKIMLCTPAYGGSVTTNYMNSVLRSVTTLPDYIEIVVNTYPGDSLITRGRNTMVAQFLASDCDALLFIDADIGFDPHHITRLVGAKKDVIGGVYPIKEIDWSRLIKAVHDTPQATKYDDVAMHSLNLVTNGIGQPNQHGIAPVFELGTGFMLIQRHVFEKLREAFPHLNYTTDRRNGDNFEVDNFFDAFTAEYPAPEVDAEGNPILLPDGSLDPEHTTSRRRYLSEDYAFCALWRQTGGEIFVDVGANMLSHSGNYTFGQP